MLRFRLKCILPLRVVGNNFYFHHELRTYPKIRERLLNALDFVLEKQSHDTQDNALVADALLLLQLEPPRNLFGTPLLPQQSLDARPCSTLDARAVRVQLSRERQFLCLLGAIATLPAVARQLARDR